jgi:orotidine-5'-phosphate decarboxylase
VSLNRLYARVHEVNSLLCIGLDPAHTSTFSDLISFNRRIIDVTHPYTAAYKLNTAFYEAEGSSGWRALEYTTAYLREAYPSIFIIADAKRSDIAHTSERYMRAFFDRLGVDAVTLNPLMGHDALAPFLEREDKVSIILGRTSNPGAADFFDMMTDGRPLWQHIVEKVATEWDARRNCMLVMGATEPQHIAQARAIAPYVPFLIPGVGAQGGDLVASVQAGITADGRGPLINVGRGILSHSAPAAAALRYQMAINEALQR